MKALEGIRVIDFSTALAAPFGSQMLAWMGAEVIKVESKQHPGLMRQTGRFSVANLSKASITLNLGRPEGITLAKRLAAVSDAVVENFRPGVFSRLGLGYQSLREIKPDIVMLSVSGFGQTGPEGGYRSYAGIFGAMGGLSHLTGYPDSIPTEERGPNDARGGQFVAFSLMAALCHRRQTGRGQYLDLSLREVVTCQLGDVLLDYVMNGRDPGRKGNSDDAMAPHNCYRCRGEDKWLSIAISNDSEWHSLCQAMGRPDLLQDERFSDTYGRLQNQDAIDAIIAGWTSSLDPREAMSLLQKAGVAAMPSFNVEEIYNDPHIRSRGFVLEVDQPDTGKQFITGPPWKMSQTADVIEPSPQLGQQNTYVFGDLLGIPRAELAALEERQVVY